MVEETIDREMKNLASTVEKLKKHLAKNKHDQTTKRALLIKEARLIKLKRYRNKK